MDEKKNGTKKDRKYNKLNTNFQKLDYNENSKLQVLPPEWARRISRDNYTLTLQSPVCARHFYPEDIMTHNSIVLANGEVQVRVGLIFVFSEKLCFPVSKTTKMVSKSTY